MCVTHVLFTGVVGDHCARQCWWPQRPLHVDPVRHHFPQSGSLCFLGEMTASCHRQEQSSPGMGSHGHFICRLLHILQPGWELLRQVGAGGFEISFRPRLWPGLCRRHGRVVAVRKVSGSFCFAGDRKAIAENAPNLRLPRQSKRDRRGWEGQGV